MRRCGVGVFFTIFAGILWILLLAIRWQYVVHVMYPGEPLGEPIWYHDPLGFWIISIACGIIAFFGLWSIFTSRMPIGDKMSLDEPFR